MWHVSEMVVSLEHHIPGCSEWMEFSVWWVIIHHLGKCSNNSDLELNCFLWHLNNVNYLYMRPKMATIWTLILVYNCTVAFNILISPVVVISWMLLSVWNAAPSSSSVPAYSTHPRVQSSLWSSHHLSTLAQVPPSGLISGLCCVYCTCWGVLALSWKWGSCLFFPLGRGLFCMDTKIQNKYSVESAQCIFLYLA